MDPSGAAGPNHYVQAINGTPFKVFNKTTGANMLTANIGSLWSPATPNDGDPIVMYDKYADRWFISQFGQTGNKMFIAISTTSDPTGSYYTYTFTSPQFPDYLKFGIWADGYYMTSNQATDRVFVFERDQMILGNPSARSISQTFTTGATSAFFVPLPADADAGLPTVGTPCPFFSYSDNAWGGGAVDGVKIWNMTTTWGATPSATIVLNSTIPTAAFDASYDAAWNDVVQPGTTQKLDGIGGVCTYRAQWRKWTGYNTVVLNWAVKISASQRSIKWVELRQNQGTGVWSLYQEGTYTPDSETRWLGSICMDNNGSIALCYLKSSTTTFPSLCYTGRAPTDPLGQMTVAETVAQAGTGSQTGGVNRVGDYSQTSLDPDGVTFWHTGEYMGGPTGGTAARTRVYSFQLPLPATNNPPVANFVADNLAPCVGVTVNFTDLSTNLPTGWAWSFSPGTVTYMGGTSATSQNPKVKFNAAGAYQVTLTATNAYGSDPEVKVAYINVVASTSIPLPINQNFESGVFPPTNWSVVNLDGNANTWKDTIYGAAPTTPKGMFINNYAHDDTGNMDEFKTVKLDFSGLSSAQMTFDVAYAPYSATYSDGLDIMVSTDCGATFTSAYSKAGLVLATNTPAAYQTTMFLPTAAQWRNETVNLTPFIGQPGVVIAFRNTAEIGRAHV